jgi:hypothetical protein
MYLTSGEIVRSGESQEYINLYQNFYIELKTSCLVVKTKTLVDSSPQSKNNDHFNKKFPRVQNQYD